ncbi:MAG: roadblock/LC7 domain-containing protein [Akkermansiaceae bacterium]|nr:roadblock/LC7 domain-containing protein [Akkermansiaceae bacterium]
MNLNGSAASRDFGWLLQNFADDTDGVSSAVVVSADGILLARSYGMDQATAEQLGAVACGMASLGNGASRLFGLDAVEQIMIEAGRGYVFSTAMGLGAVLAVVAARDCDIGLVAYAMTVLVNQSRAVLTAELLYELKNVLTP